MSTERVYNRLIPPDWDHVSRYPLSVAMPQTTPRVERFLSSKFLQSWRRFYDQGRQGACVGFGQSQTMTYYNRIRL